MMDGKESTDVQVSLLCSTLIKDGRAADRKTPLVVCRIAAKDGVKGKEDARCSLEDIRDAVET